ncbi:U11/U12 small nuclear ribonucleoprotein 25 kDa protein-like isoform X2 [Cucumis melo var. makuwa]|uniref:U11/U12 small nuclear ribonucleoprotein 25 kDa protein-like isoform X2 n=2 Tax=Cucumis melo TaxID=3656 RepID=A0A5A7U4H4_CUCMM|nr:U11/U12 small nuclear ribonucleoprotein 25 kDa protein-like [Cucumis melo]KAA0050134.1 U11/U12 small nuclear ribonucleoprotein 25 kDa protein-like isoform X2 [Cucumis melo var. makuwa]TYK06388.1 U11/U12 small nuclear ribonucleoprotein 25 kDa protein-like isoform X2 [Cucumis melo var. makuwa]
MFFMSQIEPIVPDSCCISPRFHTNSFRRSLRYNRLPPQLLRLSVLKLDGSSFEVQVERTATVAAVRDAVESVFCEMSMNKEDFNISWPHVWGHFCLCYKHFKLMDDKSRIQHFGIRDGDQLHFVELRCPVEE